MNIVLFLILATSMVGINLLKGGSWMWLSLPCYTLLALAAALSIISAPRVSKQILSCLTASAVFFGYILVRTIFSPAEYLARYDLFMVIGALIVYLLVTLPIASSNLRGTLVVILLVVALANGVVGAIQFSEGNDFTPFKSLQRTMGYGTRASGFFGCPNHLAGFLEVVLLLGLGMTFWSRWRIWAKVLLGYASVICLASIVITGSRGGLVSVLMGLLVFVVLSLLIVARQKFDRLPYVLGGGAFVLLAMGIAASFFLSEAISVRDRVQAATIQDLARLRVWPSAIRQFQLSPLFGTGAGTFFYYGRQFRDPSIQADPKYVHNDYLQLLAEFGLLGATGFLFFLVLHLRSGWRAFDVIGLRQNEFEGVGNTSLALTVGALSSVAAIVVHSIVDFNLHIPANTLLIAFVFGILANPGRLPQPGRPEPEIPAPLLARWALPMLGLWMLLAGSPKIPAEYFAWKARVALADWTTIETGEYAVRAEGFARKGLRYDARNTDLLNFLGQALWARAGLSTDLAEQERLYTESADAYQKSLNLAPRDRDTLLALGWSLDPLKRFEESEPHFKRALELDPGSAQVHWAYAAHLHSRGKLAEAEAEYRKSLAIWGGTNAAADLLRLTEEMKAKTSGPPQSAPH